jgi:hypothetical protein
MFIQARRAISNNTDVAHRVDNVWSAAHILHVLANFLVVGNPIAGQPPRIRRSNIPKQLEEPSISSDLRSSYDSQLSHFLSAHPTPPWSPTATPARQSDATASSPASKKGGLAPGFIALIVVLTFVTIGACLFFARRRYMRGKRTWRIGQMNRRWRGHRVGLSFKDEKPIDGRNLVYHDLDTASLARSDSLTSHWSFHAPNNMFIEEGNVPVGIGDRASSYRSASSDYWSNMADEQHSASETSSLSLPPLTFAPVQSNYNHTLRSAISTPSSKHTLAHTNENTQSLTADADGPGMAKAALAYTLATMQRPFIRSKPDELIASVGQQLGIIREYNDGWVLCVILDEHGMITGQGMVPSECLSKSSAKLDATTAVPGT